jgi:hypothetical protein
MQTTENMTITMTRHACKMAAQKGFDADTIMATFNEPERVYPSGSHPGQYRVTGNGLCLVGTPQEEKFVVITCYADKVLTAPRADQLNTPEGKRFAERYAAGKGRG